MNFWIDQLYKYSLMHWVLYCNLRTLNLIRITGMLLEMSSQRAIDLQDKNLYPVAWKIFPVYVLCFFMNWNVHVL